MLIIRSHQAEIIIVKVLFRAAQPVASEAVLCGPQVFLRGCSHGKAYLAFSGK